MNFLFGDFFMIEFLLPFFFKSPYQRRLEGWIWHKNVFPTGYPLGKKINNMRNFWLLIDKFFFKL